MYHYTDCGLNNVWLENGYNTVKTPYGKAVSIEDADSLHALIATDLTKKEGRLTGKEFRYLRTLLCVSQKSFAEMQGLSEQAVSLWERTGKVPKSADTTIRMLALETLKGDGKISEIIKRINTVERIVNQRIIATEHHHKWSTKAALEEKPELEMA